MADSEKITTSDVVYDSTEMQIRELSNLTAEKLTAGDLATPHIVQLLLAQQMRTLADLKAAKAEITKLHATLEFQSEDHTALRIKLAQSTERQRVFLLEILIGFSSGFAINMLTTSKFTDPIGWALLLLSALMFLAVGSITKIRLLFENKGN